MVVLLTLFLQCVSSRLVLTYVKEEAGKPDFCAGHSPAVTVTFVCPSERREVSVSSSGTSQQRLSPRLLASTGLGLGRVAALGPGTEQEEGASADAQEEVLPGTDSGAPGRKAWCLLFQGHLEGLWI